MKNIKLGNRGEELASEVLQNQGLKILERNWRFGHSEVDIIAEDDGILTFIEVKTRTSEAFGLPEQSVTAAKQQKLKQAADEYIYQTNYEGEIRFDVVAILIEGNKTDFRHFKDAFFPNDAPLGSSY